jgi:hypothetical protein
MDKESLARALKEASKDTMAVNQKRNITAEKLQEGSGYVVTQQLENGQSVNINLSQDWLNKVKNTMNRAENFSVNVDGSGNPVNVQKPQQTNYQRPTQNIVNEEDDSRGDAMLDDRYNKMLESYKNGVKNNVPSFVNERSNSNDNGKGYNEKDISEMIKSEIKRTIKEDLYDLLKETATEVMADLYTEDKIKKVLKEFLVKAKSK